jgi:hypothetical protein
LWGFHIRGWRRIILIISSPSSLEAMKIIQVAYTFKATANNSDLSLMSSNLATISFRMQYWQIDVCTQINQSKWTLKLCQFFLSATRSSADLLMKIVSALLRLL